jgi:hypothetical protein
MNRGYIDFKRLYASRQALAFAKSNLKYRGLYSRPVDKSTGLRRDQTIVLTQSFEDYPEQLRLVKFYDAENDLRLAFLTNNFSLKALTIAQLYKCRWKVELFFKWIKQHPRIKAFFGTSENAVKTQVWIAISTYGLVQKFCDIPGCFLEETLLRPVLQNFCTALYVLITIIKKQLSLEPSLYTILQILSVNILEKEPISRLLTTKEQLDENIENDNQLKLF